MVRQMNTPEQIFQTALDHFESGRLNDAEKLLRNLHKDHPRVPDILHLLGLVLLQLEKPGDAKKYLKKADKIAPGSAEILTLLGCAQHREGRTKQAARTLRDALKAAPGYADAHYNLGLVLEETGDPGQALEHYRQAAAADPGLAEAHYGLGCVLQRLGRVDESADAFKNALDAGADPAQGLRALSGAMVELGHDADARNFAEQALSLAPESPEALTAAGYARQLCQDMEGAIEAYEKAIAAGPDFTPAYCNLAFAFELANRLEEAEKIAKAGLDRFADDPALHLTLARLERRGGNPEKALKRLEPYMNMEGADQLVAPLLFELGTLYDRNEKPDSAFEAFMRANEALGRIASKAGIDKKPYLESIDRLSRQFIRDWVDTWSEISPPDEKRRLAFLVGFPRSGTTLLDLALDNHPDIRTIEELPLIDAVCKAADALPGGYPGGLAELTPDQARDLRKIYFDGIDAHLGERPEGLVIDKLPLNTAHVGLIHRVFPEAQVILSLRHPSDVCLSCFMQHFRLNEAMANFFSLEDAAAFYRRIMGLWRQYETLLPLRAHKICYEDLVADFEGEVRAVIDYLGLPWDEAALDYAGRAKQRGRINTTSYDQVMEPIYSRAAGRWRRYEDKFQPVMKDLQPFIDHFGYQDPHEP